ncbi:flavin reductase family protein [Streptomyces sp. SID3343]|uniref:flavin reductase family protein n=1 Tax=Streptomyces sp. SID3343 TaxID=2690260 RepID=UPI0031F8B5AB
MVARTPDNSEHSSRPHPTFDDFVDRLDYPMFVVTAAHPGTGEPTGCLVGFASQVSIDPPGFMVCISLTNHTHDIAVAATTLAVHALTAEQHPIASLFGEESGDVVDKFAHCGWTPGPGGVPVLDDCPRHFVGRVVRTFGLGDHTGVLLEPLDLADPQPDRSPLLMFSAVRDLDPGHAN